MARKKIQDIRPGLLPPSDEPVVMPNHYQEITGVSSPGVVTLNGGLTTRSPSVNAANIVEKQLSLLQERSDKGLLTFDETKALESLVKLQLILKTRAAASRATEDPFSELATDELKSLLSLLA